MNKNVTRALKGWERETLVGKFETRVCHSWTLLWSISLLVEHAIADLSSTSSAPSGSKSTKWCEPSPWPDPHILPRLLQRLRRLGESMDPTRWSPCVLLATRYWLPKEEEEEGLGDNILVLSMSFDANPRGAHQEIGKRTYCRAWWMSTHGPNDPSSILVFFFVFCFGEV